MKLTGFHHDAIPYENFTELRKQIKRLHHFGYKRLMNTLDYVFCGDGFCYIVTLHKA